ncbi:DUF3168 domain-containing protein [Histidinibacterium aquaticum]|uniref:DUF3168 domain-containing protein n=1 Tax=Histidinibacterium aquaticum TaxID=2613962 RepID=A0A5J5GLB5_9RHOB|nr:DUF3168 domain-containing protein [Histidinibacterium aquaticum]KAA9009035.1 DUF3168 domain-containing protein [Histidinibacterium aquaticum]
MSYALSAPLQEAVYARLSADAALAAEVGGAIFDAAPPGTAPALYVVLGDETARDRSDGTGRGARHDFTVSVVSGAAGFAAAKRAAGAISEALTDADLALSRGRLVGLRFLRARAARAQGNQVRRIDLTFRARLEDD